jgi:hypothetical protein
MKLEPDTLSDDNDSTKGQQGQSQVQRQSNVSLTSIPQIILTEPTNGAELPSELPSELASCSPQSLSPPSPRKALGSTTPLPLTKDLLRRKNKLDHLLQQQDQQPSSEYPGLNNHYVDERVTAGLGISTPKHNTTNNNSKNNGNLGSDLPSHNTVYSRGSTQIRSDTDKTLVQTHTNTHISNDSQWSNDLDIYRASMTDSHSKENRHRGRSVTTTSVSGSSNRNSASMRPYSVNHKYTHHNNGRRHYAANQPFYTRPPENHHYKKKHHTNYLINIIYSAVNRVICTRAPESKEMATNDHFDFGTTKDQIVTKSVSPKLGEKDNNDIIASISPQPPLSSSPGLIHSIASPPQSKHDHRYSWLSTQDGKSENDNLSIIDKNFSIQSSLQLKEQQKQHYYNHTTPNYHHAPDNKAMPNPLQGHSLFILGPENPLRIAAWKFIRLR